MYALSRLYLCLIYALSTEHVQSVLYCLILKNFTLLVLLLDRLYKWLKM